MQLIFKREIAEHVGFEELERQFPEVNKKSWSTWRGDATIDLRELTLPQIQRLEDWLEKFKASRGVNVLLHDLRVWKDVLKGGAQDKKPRTVRAFEPLLANYLLPVPGHRIYRRHTDGAMLCYYVTHIEYDPPRELNGGGKSPPMVYMHLVWDDVGGRQTNKVIFDAGDVLGKTVRESFAAEGFQVEDDELRAEYLAQDARYIEVANSVGTQYWAKGEGIIVTSRDYDRERINLTQYGQESRVVVDLFKEDATSNDRAKRTGSSKVDLRTYYWTNVARNATYVQEDDSYNGPDDEDVTLERPEIEVPTHPWIVVFDLAKHVRVKVHVGQLEEYIYDDDIAEKLVLPEDQKNLVKLLIDTKGGMFQDIVRGKTGGAVVLLTGEPGVGKTLTAEVYAESEHRPLYSVQCSQLGTTADTLEKRLLETFDRARRWNAVLLIDEADVYIRERKDDMEQNAIVGVFLRVLEYQVTTLFLTSNRPEVVDDAIASRCIARLYYTAPDVERAERIWKILAANSNIPISGATIVETVRNNPGMSGRDIKNILKLANLMRKEGEPITTKEIEFVKQFKPTGIILEKAEN